MAQGVQLLLGRHHWHVSSCRSWRQLHWWVTTLSTLHLLAVPSLSDSKNCDDSLILPTAHIN